MTSFQILALSAALALPACVIVDDGDDDAGLLSVEWTLDGLREPLDCDFFGADRLELSVYDIFDDLVVTQYAFCEDFGTSMGLEEGFYSVDATFVDSANRPVSVTQILDDVDVFEDEELIVSIDFRVRDFR
jgi:hypothetical protein